MQRHLQVDEQRLHANPSGTTADRTVQADSIFLWLTAVPIVEVDI